MFPSPPEPSRSEWNGYIKRQDRRRDRLDQRHRIGLCARFRRRRRQCRPQRHGRAGRYRARAFRHRDRFQGPRRAFARRHDQARRDRRNGRARREDLRFGRYPRQQCRHPVRVADRGVSAGEVGSDHRHQPVVGVLRHPRRGARHEEARLGPHHQHGFRAFAGRFAVQVGLCLGQARHRRPHQDGGAGACDLQDHLQLHQSRVMSGRRWSRNRFPRP